MSTFQQQPMYPSQGFPVKPQRSNGKATFSLVLGILSFCLSILTGIPAVILGALALRDVARSNGTMGGKGAAIGGIITGVAGVVMSIPGFFILVALMLPAFQAARDAARHQHAHNDMRFINMALFNYNDVHGGFPATGDPNAYLEGGGDVAEGAGLSWRVHLLPYLEEQALYEQFHLDEPWDSDHNKSLISQMPDVYASPAGGGRSGMTSYLAVVPGANCPPHLHTAMVPHQQTRMANILDGASQTIIVIDAGPNNAVEWTKPSDYEVNYNSPRGGLEFGSNTRFSALFVDGAVLRIDSSMADEDVLNMFFANDGNPIPYF